MNHIVFIIILFVIILPLSIFAQVSPLPVIEKEIRNGTSIKLRSADLERVKRDAAKSNSRNSNPEAKINFTEIKKDFESIQILQNSIVKAYTTGKKINYKKIDKAAKSMEIKARRLKLNMFSGNSIKATEIEESKKIEKYDRLNLRNLIIELDRSIGSFVKSPIFKDLRVFDTKVSKNAQTDLNKIIYLSHRLYRLAENSK